MGFPFGSIVVLPDGQVPPAAKPGLVANKANTMKAIALKTFDIKHLPTQR